MASQTTSELETNIEDKTRILLNKFLYPGATTATETEVIELLSQIPNPAAISGRHYLLHSVDFAKYDVWRWKTLVHLACCNGWYNVMKTLIEAYRYDVDDKDYTGGTPLQWACRRGDLRIVKYLVSEHHCNPQRTGWMGAWTPFETACFHGHLNIVKYLLTECVCDPLKNGYLGNTPLTSACRGCSYAVVAYLLCSGKVDKASEVQLLRTINPFSRDYMLGYAAHSRTVLSSLVWYKRNRPFHAAFKVFVIGNQSAGKSTLVKALEDRLTDTSFLGSWTGRFRKVTGVELRTAGIIPTHVHSPGLGHIILYDFAGQYEYYSSHAAYLENLVTSLGVLFLLVVDISKSAEEIVRTLQYWSSFINNLCSHCRSLPRIVVIGSHADVVKSQGQNPSEKLSLAYTKVSSSLCTSFKETKVVLNCTKSSSSSLSSITSIISTCSQTFQKECEVDMQVHILNGVIKSNFKVVTNFSNLTQFLFSDVKFRVLRDTNVLPSDDATLSKHLTTLSEHGQLIYLRNDQDINDSWVIINKELLLSKVNGTIFAPDYFKQHHDISSSTGVVPLSEIKKIFPDHDPQMIVGFLTHLEFCHQIEDSEASLISKDLLQPSDNPSETYYFFPALVSAERPEESCKSFESSHHKSGWCLERIKDDQFFTPRFLHVLLLRLAFTFALAPDTPKESAPSPVARRECNVWRCGITDGGIHWINMDGVEAIVEVVEQSTAVTMVVGCQEGEEMAGVQLRSDLIRTVLQIKEKFSGAVEARESLIHPSELATYPLKSPLKDVLSFSIHKVAKSISEEKKFVTSKH